MKIKIMTSDAIEYINIFNQWENVCFKYKQDAAVEFYNRYNTNHFTDFLLKMEN